MDHKPFLHKHYLLFDKYQNQEALCNECNQKIDGWAFTCELCKFWLHQSCAEKKLPPMISHPLHSKLSLQKIDYKDFSCDKCFTLSRGCRYSNEDRSFNLDVICAFSINDQTVKEESERSKNIGRNIHHFCHGHSLTLINYRKVRWFEYCCSWCEKPLSGMSYGCVQCSSPFFLHEFCLHTIPNKILEHHFHPHPLYIGLPFSLFSTCAVCLEILPDYNYYCRKCDFYVHVFCARLKPTLRHECHKHDLTYIATKERGSICNKCEKDVELSRLYRCVPCNYNVHLECLVPSTSTHKYHPHSLTIMTSFKEDGWGEYFCDICEEQRNPEHPVYSCKECTYIAHIGCGLDSKVVDAKLHWGSTSILKQNETQQKDSDFTIHHEGLKIEHFGHKHPLIFKEVIEENKNPLCEACEVEVCHEAYVCEKGCRYYLHKKCAELSYEVLNPRHSVDHPLFFLGSHLINWEIQKDFICGNCREVSGGFRYCCFQCNFNLDTKCAVAIASSVKQGPQGVERLANLSHFFHNHELHLVNCRPTSIRSFWCGACSLIISGPAYCCLQNECRLFVHDSCLRKLPREIQIQSHPQHNLLPNPNARISNKVCLACKTNDPPFLFAKNEYPSFWYNCLQCDIYIHFYCAGSLLQRPLSSKSHSHNLYLFSRDKPRLLQKHQSSKCGKCNKLLKNQSIYHCVQCDISFHLQCVEIFYRVKCKHHIHHLNLKGCFAEDDSEEYYCDVCEEKRDPKNDVYYCEECDGHFITHLECAAAEVEEVLQQYGPFPYSLLEEEYGPDHMSKCKLM